MITDDGVEIHDFQQQEAGGGEDYTRPFGTPETKEESLGFLDKPAPPISRTRRIARWLYKNLYRPWLFP